MKPDSPKKYRRPRAPMRPDARRAGKHTPPTNSLSWGTVGHADPTPTYARVEMGAVLVEVTLVPSGDEIIARLPTGAPGWYFPIHFGAHVVIAMPDGSGAEPVLMCRVPDGAWPWPTTVGGIAAQGAPAPTVPPSTALPMFAFCQTEAGELLVIETGPGGDVVVQSGASVKIAASPGSQVLIKGRTHIGADFTAPPVGATVGPAGAVVPGVAGTPYVPVPHVPIPFIPGVVLPPVPVTGPIPADGVVRAKDPVQSDATVDPYWWTFVNAVYAHPLIYALIVSAVPTPPLGIGSAHKGASKNTVAD